MTITFEELKERLKTLDEITLLEVLNLSSEDLVETFESRIEARMDEFMHEFENDDDSGK